jgi:hypothetical protein
MKNKIYTALLTWGAVMVEGISGSQPSYPSNYPSDPNATTTNAVWYTTWRLQPDQPPPIPQGVNLVNLFVGALSPTEGVTGLQGPFANPDILRQFVHDCNMRGIKVCVSIGGHGGNYDSTWDQLNSGNVSTFATALKNFCDSTGVQGIDFDWEPDSWTQDQGTLVGQLIKGFKDISGLQTSLCTNSGPAWEEQESWVFDAAKNADGSSSIDRLNIMAYYPASEAEGWINDPGGWEDFAKKYGLSRAQITVGMLGNASDLQQFSQWDKAQGLSTSLWFWDPGAVDQSNQETEEVWDIYHPGAPPSILDMTPPPPPDLKPHRDSDE